MNQLIAAHPAYRRPSALFACAEIRGNIRWRVADGPMPWLLLLVYAALIWLIFVKLKCIHLALPIAIVLAAGPLVLFYIAWAMRLYHPHSSDVQALRRLVEVPPRPSKPGHVTELMVRPYKPL